jgi:hypothetical protein
VKRSTPHFANDDAREQHARNISRGARYRTLIMCRPDARRACTNMYGQRLRAWQRVTCAQRRSHDSEGATGLGRQEGMLTLACDGEVGRTTDDEASQRRMARRANDERRNVGAYSDSWCCTNARMPQACDGAPDGGRRRRGCSGRRRRRLPRATRWSRREAALAWGEGGSCVLEEGESRAECFEWAVVAEAPRSWPTRAKSWRRLQRRWW